MKYLYTIVMAMLVLASCSENERMVYTDTGSMKSLFRKIPRRWPENIMKRCSIGLLMKLINRFLLFRWW